MRIRIPWRFNRRDSLVGYYAAATAMVDRFEGLVPSSYDDLRSLPGVGDYTDVKAGGVALNNAADLYLYPNALHAVKLDGAGLKAWLEKSAERFNRIDPASGALRTLHEVEPHLP